MSVETSWRRSGAPSRISTSCSVSRRSAKMRAGAPSMNAGARPSRRRFGVCALVIGLGVITPAAHAERPVYRNLDDTGGVVYSDRALGPGSARVKIWKAANPSRSQYDAAVLQAETDRLYYERLRAEDRIPRPIVVYQPRRDAARAAPLA